MVRIKLSDDPTVDSAIAFMPNEYLKLVQIKIAGEALIYAGLQTVKIRNCSGSISARGKLLGKQLTRSREVIEARLGLKCLNIWR